MLELNAFNAGLNWLFPSTVGRSLEFMAVKNFGKEFGSDDLKNEWTAR